MCHKKVVGSQFTVHSFPNELCNDRSILDIDFNSKRLHLVYPVILSGFFQRAKVLQKMIGKSCLVHRK